MTNFLHHIRIQIKYLKSIAKFKDLYAKCNICKIEFEVISDLIDHIRNHTSLDNISRIYRLNALIVFDNFMHFKNWNRS